MIKLNCVIMGQNCERYLRMCLESVKEADHIIYCDGGSIDGSLEIAKKYRAIIIENPYDQEDKGMNGKQREFYLQYLKDNFRDEFIICLDADEILSENGINKIKCFLENTDQRVFEVHMRHLIGFLNHEDSTVERHYVQNRLYKISDDLYYDEVEHPILKGNFNSIQRCDKVTIWHLAYIPGLWEFKKRYENHLKKSNIHTPEFLKQWYWAHIFNKYPKREFDPIELPNVILKEFNIDKDELYFQNRRTLEMKHWIDSMHWIDYWELRK